MSGNHGDNRRQWGRYPTRAEILLETEAGKKRGIVVDESIGGIGIETGDPRGLSTDSKLSVVYNGMPMEGRVKSVRESKTGRYRVGIGWVEMERESQKSARTGKETAFYYNFNDLRVICRDVGPPTAISPGGTPLTLWPKTLLPMIGPLFQRVNSILASCGEPHDNRNHLDQCASGFAR